MNRRGLLFLILIGAAILIPYASSKHGEGGAAAWWDSMWTDSVEDGMTPTATTTPTPDWGVPLTSTYIGTPSATPGGMTPGGMTPGMTTQLPVSGAVPSGSSSEWRTVRVLSPQGYPSGGASNVSAGYPTGPLVQNATDLIRFDLTPDWIMSQWPRVSTGLRDGKLEGLRVAMVSGTGIQDVAGSLTYYFDAQHVMQRIVFNGSTGDPSPLVTDLTRRFGLVTDPDLGGHVWVRRVEGRLTGWLEVRPAAIIRASEPFQRYDVRLELANPRSPLPLGSRFIPKQALTPKTTR